MGTDKLDISHGVIPKTVVEKKITTEDMLKYLIHRVADIDESIGYLNLRISRLLKLLEEPDVAMMQSMQGTPIWVGNLDSAEAPKDVWTQDRKGDEKKSKEKIWETQ